MNPLVVYKASAGSGKTFTLALEYIKLLLLFHKQHEYRHILAVTFTNKATTEMKERILSQLYSLAHRLGDSDDFIDALNRAFAKDRKNLTPMEIEEYGLSFPIDDDDIRQRAHEALNEILHDYNHFRVQTIDSFFQLVLRGLAHELGLAANLQVDISDKEVLEDAVDRVVDEMSRRPEIKHWIESLANDRLEDMAGWDVTKAVKEFARNIFNQDYLLLGDDMRQALGNPGEADRIFKALKAMKSELGKRYAALADRMDAVVQSSGFQYEWMTYSTILPRFIMDLRMRRAKPKALKATLTKWPDKPESVLSSKERKDNSKIVAATSVGYVLAEVLNELTQLSFEWNSVTLALEHFNALLLLNHIDQEVTAINSENNRFTLAKTPILIREMIGQDDAPFIFEKIGADLHHIMIDEFQDTSSLQWQNFRSLLLECRSRGGRNLVVGDVKQSIYRWRGGDWRTLGHIDTDVEEQVLAPMVESLDTNFRSHQVVIDFNNDFFLHLATTLDDCSEKSERLLGIKPRIIKDKDGTERSLRFFENAYADVCQKVGKHNDGSGYVRICVPEPASKDAEESSKDKVINDLMSQVRSLLDAGLPASKMAILIRFKYEAEAIIQAFAQREDMPKVVSDEAFMLSSSEAVQMIMMALRVIDRPKDSVVHRFYLKERGIELQDDEVAAWRTVPLYDLVEQLYLRLLPSGAHDQDAYLFGFLDAVADYQRNHAGGIHAFISYWEETLQKQSVAAGEIDGIRILTIHKSKGLEFHTVFVPFCDWDIAKGRHTEIIWCKTDTCPEPFSDMHLIPVSSKTDMADSVFAKPYHEYLLNTRFDELNAVYVAFTRARCNLFVWAVTKGFDPEKEKMNVGELVYNGVGGNRESTQGVPITSDDKKKQEQKDKKEEENRMQPRSRTCAVTMQSFAPQTTFCQSNSSKDFLASLSESNYEDEVILNEISRQRMYIDIGRLLHRVFQNIRTWDDVPSALDSFEHEGLIGTGSDAGNLGLDRQYIEKIIDRGRRNSQVSSWFDGSWKLFNECAIVSVDPDTHIPTRRRPDRVMMSQDGSRIIVVDFKFGKYIEEYDQQVQDYMDLLSQMYPSAHIEGFLWFVYSGKIKKTHPQPLP